MSSPDEPARADLPIIGGVEPAQAEAFSILRRAQIERDRPSDEVRGFCVGGRIGELGLNPALARRGTTSIGDVWVIPGNGHIALCTGGGGGASPTEIVARQGTVTWTSSQDGQGIVHGLVPDGVEEVTLFDSADARQCVAVNENTYGARLGSYFRSLRFTGPAGEVSLGPWS